MDIIVPTTLTSAMLVSSNILENQYNEWEDGGFKTLSAGAKNWRSLAKDASNGIWAVVYGGDIYYAADGINFVAQSVTTNQNWTGICVCPLTGDVYACIYNGSIWRKAYGGSWADLSETSRRWLNITADLSGNIYAITLYSDTIWRRASGAGTFDVWFDMPGGYVWYLSGLSIDNANGDVLTHAYDVTNSLSYIAKVDIAAATHMWWSTNSAMVWVNDLYYDNTDTTLYCAIQASSRAAGIWYSADGSTWTNLGEAGGTYKGVVGIDGADDIWYSNYGVDIMRRYGTAVYSDGDTVQVTSGANLSDHKIYESLTNNNEGNAVTDTTNWLLIGNTTRTKAFDGTIGAQSSKASFAHWVLAPGAIDSVALLNISATALRVAEADHSTDKVTNGTAWTGATGTTQPTGWDKVGTPTDFTIDSGALKLTVDGNEGISQTIAVTAGTAMMLNGTYKNTSGDVAQIAIYDETHSSDILAVTDLDSSTQYATLNYIFSVPAGCSSLTIKLLAKTSGDIVWFDNISLSDVSYYSGTVTIGTYTSEYVNTSLTKKADSLVRVSVYHATGNALVGEMILGVKTNLGTTSKEISGGIKDYSTIEEDTYGYQSITDRGIAKKLSCQVTLPITSFDAANSIVAYYHTTAVVWVASTTYNSTVIYGMYRDYKFQLGDKIATLFFDLQGLV